MTAQIVSIQPVGKAYTEIIEVRVPVRFYFVGEEYDGIEFGPFEHKLLPWEQALVDRVLNTLQKEMEK